MHTLVAVPELTKIVDDDKIRRLYLTLFAFKQEKSSQSQEKIIRYLE